MDLGRNLETIRRQSGQWSDAPLMSEAQEAMARRTLFGWLPSGRLSAITELGFSAGAEAALPELNAAGSAYFAFERRPSRLAAGDPACVRPLPTGAELPGPTASQDLFLALFTLERLRMDELYMLISEMRRLVKPGAYAALAALHPGDGLAERWAAKAYAKLGRGSPLQLSHYLSPEDWEPVREEDLRLGGGRVARLMLLRRLAEPGV